MTMKMTSRDAAFVFSIACCVGAAAVDLVAGSWHTLLLPVSVLFLVVTMRAAVRQYDRLLTARIAKAEADQKIAEMTVAAIERSVAAGNYQFNVEQMH